MKIMWKPKSAKAEVKDMKSRSKSVQIGYMA